ncbi:MAG: phosphoglucosamine mutase [Opitutales bacterium]|jgi:phosphoglucosamine mutase
MSLHYFGTDGIRGTYGEAPLDLPTLRRLGYALGRWLALRQPDRKLRIVAGRDPRLSGPAILAAVAEGLIALGHEVTDLGVLPTPAVPMALLDQRADFGLMITASHNPPADNGVKLFDDRGLKLEHLAELEIEGWLDREPAPDFAPRQPILPKSDAIESYCRSRAALLPPNALAGWTIALDPGHGATCQTTPEVFRRLGATVKIHAGEPDGARINVGSGSEHPEKLAELVRASKARLGFAHDGDGDRLVACDESGTVVDGDQILGILALHALRRGQLNAGVLVATVQSNLGLDQAVQAAGGRVIRVPVGDRNVLHELLELNASLGGENSGHFIFPEQACCGDGLLAALMLTRVLLETGRPLSSLRTDVPLLPQLTANLRVREKIPLETLPNFFTALCHTEEKLAGRGRILARYSGTEKKLRLLVEGPNRAELATLLASLKAAAVTDLGAE